VSDLIARYPVATALPAPRGQIDSANAYITPRGQIVNIGKHEHSAAARTMGMDVEEMLELGYVRYGAWGNSAYVEIARPLTDAQFAVLSSGVPELAGRSSVATFSLATERDEQGEDQFALVDADDRRAVTRLLRQGNRWVGGGQARRRRVRRSARR
jgi:hypothetical protein